MAGDPPAAGHDGLAVGQAGPVRPGLGGPLPADLAEPVAGQPGQYPGGRVRPDDRDRLVAVVADHEVAFDHVAAGGQPIMRSYGEGVVPVGELDHELVLRAGLAGEGQFQITGAVRETHLNSRVPEPHRPGRRQIENPIGRVLERPPRRRPLQQAQRLLQRQPHPPVQGVQAILLFQVQDVRGGGPGQHPQPSRGVVDDHACLSGRASWRSVRERTYR